MKIRKAVFPLAGLGSRMAPITKSIPKGMLSVLNKPLIHYAVEEAVNAGITNIIFIMNNLKNSITKYFHLNNTKAKIHSPNSLTSLVSKIDSLVFIRQAKALGLGHAILCAKSTIGSEPFAVLLADDIIKAKYSVLGKMIQHFNTLKSSIIAISKIKYTDTHKYGILDAHPPDSNGITKISDLVEKPTSIREAPSDLAIVGRYILTPNIFEFLMANDKKNVGELHLTSAIKKIVKHQPVYGYQYQGSWFDCGNKLGLQMANIAFAMNESNLKKELTPFLKELI